MDFLIDTLNGFLTDRNEDDFFDRLNYQYTPTLFILLAMINITKLYVGSAITCFSKAEFPKSWNEYSKDYCLIENTYYLRTDESIPIELETRNSKQISYYQWVPFMLILQAASFYLVHTIWRAFNWISGYQIRMIITAAKESSAKSEEDITKSVETISKSMYHASLLKHRTVVCLREQKFVTFLYFLMKLCYLFLICFHLGIFKHFIGSLGFAWDVVASKAEWEQNGLFPRVTVCDFSIEKNGQPTNYTLECVLPLNMFNEKIFVFFFFWLCFLFAGTLFSIFKWINAIASRKQFFKKLLSIASRQRHGPASHSNTYSPPPGEHIPLLDNSSTTSSVIYDPNHKDPNSWDLRLILGLIQDHAGLLFCSRIYREMCNINDQKHRENVQNNYNNAETIKAQEKAREIERSPL
uniref:Innexin n=1 Tax=Acrobeloides nanus TaxID=290746 RepID=A0A914BZ58_9BILA